MTGEVTGHLSLAAPLRTDAGPPYSGDFTMTVWIVAHKMAVGTVKLLDLATESDYGVRHQGTPIVSK